MNPLLFLEFNEINFPMIEAYASLGELPNFNSLIETHGYRETESEAVYENIEPWIQWVTAHTGKTLSEHGVFRLGDMVDCDLEQIWERLESGGVLVGAMSPMNAINRTSNAAFFVPDPWTKTEVTGSFLTKRAHHAICQAVGSNAEGKVRTSSLLWLLSFAAANVRPSSYSQFLKLATQVRSRKWVKAMMLDLLLANAFISQVRRTGPGFATLFLNAAAHIQHHYMFSSSVYNGPFSNPSWHIREGIDPILDVYRLYDQILGQIRRCFPDSRLMLATGLHQDPHDKETYYWRLRDHEAFLKKIGAPFQAISPLMSRDFIVSFDDGSVAEQCQSILESCVDTNGTKLFEIDNRGTSLFVMLTYPSNITPEFHFTCQGEAIENFYNDVAFVAIKNGKHNGVGYFMDTGSNLPHGSESIPLSTIPELIIESICPRISKPEKKQAA